MSAPAMAVEIDEAIRRDPDLLRDVEAATAVLRELPGRIETFKPPSLARWQLARGTAGHLELGLYDLPPGQGVGTRRQFPADSLATDQLRALTVLRSVSDLLSERLKAGPSFHTLFGQLIENLEAADAAQV